MDPDQEQRAASWLSEKFVTPVCPVCHATAWQIGDIVELRPFSGGDLVVGGAIFPAFQVICGNCGNTLLFNALLSGVLDEPKATEE